MRLMAKINEIGLIIYTMPGYGIATFPEAGQSLDRFGIGNNVAMASHALLD
jgi:hypothetical protein